jgi:hypothetical protein
VRTDYLSMESAYIDAGACRTDQHTVLWRIDKALLGQDEPVFKLHYSRQGNLKLTGISLFPQLAFLFLLVGCCLQKQ